MWGVRVKRTNGGEEGSTQGSRCLTPMRPKLEKDGWDRTKGREEGRYGRGSKRTATIVVSLRARTAAAAAAKAGRAASNGSGNSRRPPDGPPRPGQIRASVHSASKGRKRQQASVEARRVGRNRGRRRPSSWHSHPDTRPVSVAVGTANRAHVAVKVVSVAPLIAAWLQLPLVHGWRLETECHVV